MKINFYLFCAVIIVPFIYGAAHLDREEKKSKEVVDIATTRVLPGEISKDKSPRMTMDSSGKNEFRLSFKVQPSNFEVFVDKFKKIDLANVYFKKVLMIGKYADPYNFLSRMVLIENIPPMLTALIPDVLLKELTAYFDVSLLNLDKKSFFETFGPNIDFNTIIWGRPPLAKPKDKIYNLVFHPIVRAWAAAPGVDEHNLLRSVSVGLFEPDGVLEVVARPPHLPRGIAFNGLRAESISIHPAGDGGLAFSPDNVFFQLAPNRDVVSFWTLALSPESGKQANITLNYIIDSADLEDKLYTLIDKAPNINTLISAIESVASGVKNLDDKKALLGLTSKLNKMLEALEVPAIDQLFPDISLNKLFNPFPVSLVDSNVKLKLFQIEVASQYKSGIGDITFGNTCGRHAIKNGICGLRLMSSYNKRQDKEFMHYASCLTKIDGNEKVGCIFKGLDKSLSIIRGFTGEDIKRATVSTGEMEYLINDIKDVVDSCHIAGVTKEQFSLYNSDFIMGAGSIEAVAIEEALIAQLKSFAKTLDNFKQYPEFQHIFILGINEKTGPHWFVLQATQINNVIKYCIFDSLNNKNRINEPVVLKLIDLLEKKPYSLRHVEMFLLIKKFKDDHSTIQIQIGQSIKEIEKNRGLYKLADLLVKLDNEIKILSFGVQDALVIETNKALINLRTLIFDRLVQAEKFASGDKKLSEAAKLLSQATLEYDKTKKSKDYLDLMQIVLK